jgi:VWFA-related protein
VQLLDRGGPVWLVLVLDVSQSVQGEKLQRLRDGCETVIQQLKAGDEVALLTFSEEASVVVPLSPHLDVPSTKLRDVQAGGRTALYDAVFTALALVRHGTERTLVVVFSDGQDTMSILDPVDVRRIAREANAVVYGVLTEAPAVRKDSLWLSDVAHDTGGRTLVARSLDTLSKVFLQIVAEFRSRYVLVYTPTGVGRDDGWHDIEVSLLNRRGKLTTRRGYVATP